MIICIFYPFLTDNHIIVLFSMIILTEDFLCLFNVSSKYSVHVSLSFLSYCSVCVLYLLS